MTKIDKKVILNLVGINNHAFAIMGAFKKAAKKQGWTEEEINVVIEEAKSGDYQHLLSTITNYTE